MLKVAFTGGMGSGKSAAALMVRLLAEAADIPVWNVRFSEPVYGIVMKMLGDDYDEAPQEIRRAALQLVGEGARKFKPDIWVVRAVDTIDTIEANWGETDGIIVIDDLRYANELDALRELEFQIFRVTAPEGLRAQRRGIPVEKLREFSEHPSERYTHRMPVDAELDGSGTLGNLLDQITEVIHIAKS